MVSEAAILALGSSACVQPPAEELLPTTDPVELLLLTVAVTVVPQVVTIVEELIGLELLELLLPLPPEQLCAVPPPVQLSVLLAVDSLPLPLPHPPDNSPQSGGGSSSRGSECCFCN